MNEVLIVARVGLATTSSAMAGTAIELYWPLSKHSLACILAFAAGALISALAIDLAFHGAVHLHYAGFSQLDYEISPACLPRHLAVAYLCLVRW